MAFLLLKLKYYLVLPTCLAQADQVKEENKNLWVGQGLKNDYIRSAFSKCVTQRVYIDTIEKWKERKRLIDKTLEKRYNIRKEPSGRGRL